MIDTFDMASDTPGRLSTSFSLSIAFKRQNVFKCDVCLFVAMSSLVPLI